MATIQNVNNGDSGLVARTKLNNNDNALNMLPQGQINIGNASSIATPQTISGAISLLPSGSTSLTTNSVNTGNIVNSAVTNAKLFTANANTWKGNNTPTGNNISDNNSASLTEITSSVLTISGAANALLNPATITVQQATTSTSGYLSNTDWNTFNDKQTSNNRLSDIAALTSPGNIETIGITPAGNIISYAQVDATESSDPTSSDDNTQGYIIGSLWINIDTNILWYCLDAGTGSAIWLPVSATSSQSPQGVNEYFVSSAQGNDSNNGSLLFPFATIQHAVDIIQSGNGIGLIRVAPGSYSDDISITTALYIKIIGQADFIGDTQNANVSFCTIAGNLTIGGAANGTYLFDGIYFNFNDNANAVINITTANSFVATFSNMNIENQGSGPSIIANPAYVGMGELAFIILDNCNMSGAIQLSDLVSGSGGQFYTVNTNFNVGGYNGANWLIAQSIGGSSLNFSGGTGVIDIVMPATGNSNSVQYNSGGQMAGDTSTVDGSGNYNSISSINATSEGNFVLNDGGLQLINGGTNSNGSTITLDTFTGYTNQIAGQNALVGGTLVINTTAALTSSLVFLQRVTTIGSLGELTYTIDDGVSLTINSDNPIDASIINWMIIQTTSLH